MDMPPFFQTQTRKDKKKREVFISAKKHAYSLLQSKDVSLVFSSFSFYIPEKNQWTNRNSRNYYLPMIHAGPCLPLYPAQVQCVNEFSESLHLLVTDMALLTAFKQ